MLGGVAAVIIAALLSFLLSRHRGPRRGWSGSRRLTPYLVVGGVAAVIVAALLYFLL